MTKPKIANKAIVASAAGAVIVRTHDGQQIVVSPDLAREIGQQMIGMSYLSSPPGETAIMEPNWTAKKGAENG